jgi:hypothetical protein
MAPISNKWSIYIKALNPGQNQQPGQLLPFIKISSCRWWIQIDGIILLVSFLIRIIWKLPTSKHDWYFITFCIAIWATHKEYSQGIISCIELCKFALNCIDMSMLGKALCEFYRCVRWRVCDKRYGRWIFFMNTASAPYVVLSTEWVVVFRALNVLNV